MTLSFVFFWNIAVLYKFTQDFSGVDAPKPTAVEEPKTTQVKGEFETQGLSVTCADKSSAKTNNKNKREKKDANRKRMAKQTIKEQQKKGNYRKKS